MNDKDDQKDSVFASVIFKKSEKQKLVKHLSTHEAIDETVPKGDGNAQKDKRILLTKYFIAVVFLTSMMGIFATGKVVDESFFLVVMFFILATINYMGFYVLRQDVSSSLIFSLLCLYVWVAFPLKLMVAVNDPGALWISQSMFDSKIVGEEIAGSFVSVFPALAFLFLGLFLFHRTIHKKSKYLIRKVHHIRFISIIIFLMCLRVFNQLVLDIGIPGVRPPVLPIPYLSGVLELMSRPVLFAVVNLYFYYVIRLNITKKIWISLLLLFVNIILGLRVGYKSELILQGLLLIYYSFEVFPYLSKTTRKFMITVTASMIVIIMLLYPLVNHYRSYILSGMDFSEAIDSAQKRSEKQSESFSLAFLDRINGISEFYAATKLGEGREFGYDALFNNSVMELIKEKLYGADKNKATVAFGTTVFSVVYLVGGGFFLVVYGFIIGWIIRWSSSFLKYKVFKSSFTYYAYLPLLCILWVKLLSSGGNLMLYIKELTLVIICLFLLEKYGAVVTKIARK